METYQITDLERITGIKAHTIRIWEKRFDLIKPKRTATNIRFYDDEQVRHLLNIATLIEHGHKISEIAALTSKQIASRLDEIYNSKSSDEDVITNAFINDLIAATISFNEPQFEKVFASATTRLGMYKAILMIVYPFLKRIGLLWSTDEIAPIQEHFATNIIRRKIIAAIDGLPLATKKNKKFLLFLPPEEWHELALLFSDYLIRSAGYPVIYLGQNVPYKKLGTVIEDTKPTHILTFHISNRLKDVIMPPLIEIRHKHKGVNILIGGSSALFQDLKLSEGIRFLSTPVELETYI